MSVRLVGTDLHSLCNKGDLKTMNESWTKYAEQIELLKAGKTPLHEAAGKGHTSVVDFLLSKGAKPNTLSVKGETALYYAAEGKHTECEMILLDYKASVEAGKITPLGTQDKEFLTLLTSNYPQDIPETSRIDLVNRGLETAMRIESIPSLEKFALLCPTNLHKVANEAKSSDKNQAAAFLILVQAATDNDSQLVERLYSTNKTGNALSPATRKIASSVSTRVPLMLAKRMDHIEVFDLILTKTGFKSSKSSIDISWDNLGIDHLSQMILSRISLISYWSLTHNELQSFECFGVHLAKLRVLDASHNQITSVDPELFEMPRLISLNLSHNRLSSLPKLKSNSCQLTRLDLSSNKFNHVPFQLVNCSCLSYLNLSYNAINRLPEWLASVGNLDDLRLEGVPLLNQDEKRDFQETIKLLKIKLDNASRVNEMKVLVTGPSKEGKSQFVSLFCNAGGQSPPNGTFLKRWACTHSENEKSYNYAVWEVAGFDSDSTIPVEKLLYTKFSTIVLVYDISKGVSDIGKLWVWLDAIAERASPSCVLFFGYVSSNNKGKNQVKLITDIHNALSPLVKAYSDTLVFGYPVFFSFSISNKRAEAKMICDAMHRTASLLEWRDGQPYMGRLVHNSAVAFKEQVDLLFKEGKQVPVMTIESMETIVSNLKTVEIHGPKELVKISKFLSDVGSVLSFTSTHNQLFNVCDLNWFLLGMWTIFEKIKPDSSLSSALVTVTEEEIQDHLLSLPNFLDALQNSLKAPIQSDSNFIMVAKSLISILVDFKVLLPLTASKSKCSFLAPFHVASSPVKSILDLLPNVDLHIRWKYTPQHYLARRTWVNIIDALLKHILIGNDISFKVFRDAFVIEDQNLIISFSEKTRSILLLTSCFTNFFKQVKRIVADVFPHDTSVEVICPKCLQEGHENPYEIPLLKCLEAMLNAQESVECQQSTISENHRVSLVNLIPHLLIFSNLAALQNFEFSKDVIMISKSSQSVRRTSEVVGRFSIDLKTEADFERMHDKSILLRDFSFPCLSSSEGILTNIIFQQSGGDGSPCKSEAIIIFLVPTVGPFSEISSENFIPHVLVFRVAMQLARAIKVAPSLSQKLEDFLMWSLDSETAFCCSLAVESVHDVRSISNKKRVDCWKFYMTKLIELAKSAAYIASGKTLITMYAVLEHILDICKGEDTLSLDSIIASLSPVKSQLLSRLHCLSDGHFSVTGCYHVLTHSIVEESSSLENDGLQRTELWLPQHNRATMQLKLCTLTLDSLAIKTYPVQSLNPKEVLAVKVCCEYVWISSLIQDNISCLSIIEIETKSIVHNIKMKRNAVTCFAESKETGRVYMGTKAGFLFDFTSDVEAIRTQNPKPKHKLISECEIVSLVIVGKFLWVSTGNSIYQLNCSWDLGSPKLKEFWLSEIKSGLSFHNLSMAPGSNLMYSFTYGGKCIFFLNPAVQEHSETIAYYNDPRNCLDLSEVIVQISSSISETLVAISSVAYANSCLWVGLASGHILVFHREVLICHMQPYRQPVRSLCVVTNEINGMQEFYVLSCGRAVMLPELLSSVVAQIQREDDVLILWHAPSKKVLSQMNILEESCGHYLDSYSSLADVIHKGGFNDEIPTTIINRSTPALQNSSSSCLPSTFKVPKPLRPEISQTRNASVWGCLSVKFASEEVHVFEFLEKPRFSQLENEIVQVLRPQLPASLQLGYSLGQHELLVSVSSDEELDSYIDITLSNRPPLLVL